MFTVRAPISLGELVDKITILEIKLSNLSEAQKLSIQKELTLLLEILNSFNFTISLDYINRLRSLNRKLWDIEDSIRMHENTKRFDDKFIELARSVYQNNDLRYTIKKEINLRYNSDIIEEKSYKAY